MASYGESIPARLDRLPWCRFHQRVVLALGITWMLDGLEVTLSGAISGILQNPGTLGFSASQIGLIGSFYLIGAVLGALIFGYWTDHYGRKKMFFVTLAVYLAGAFLTAFSWNLWSFCLFRLITGAGIGGEYAAINSAIDELIPARCRGRVDLAINGSYWIGAILASLMAIILLDYGLFSVNVGWRLGFGSGAIMGIYILCLRRNIPESPRWLLLHGRKDEAEQIITLVEDEIRGETGATLPPVPRTLMRASAPLRSLPARLSLIFNHERKRALVSLLLMTAQAFFYNAIFFTYAMVLTRFYRISEGATGYYLLPFAIGNFLGPLILGKYFDSIGRRKMIGLTYFISGALLVVTGALFRANLLTAVEQTLLWSVIFFFASAAASSAYLTISEIFPLEVRAFAIAIFFAIGTAIGGVVAPYLFGVLIDTGSRHSVFLGYAAASALMIVTAVVQFLFGIDAEGKSLEEVAPGTTFALSP